MSDDTANFDTDTTSSTDTSRRGPSVVLLLAGLASLLVSAWAFAGPESWDWVPPIETGWVIVIAAIVVGAFLIVSPGRRRAPRP